MAPVDPQPQKKRPLYLVAALALSFALGTGGWVGGCESIGYYHGDTNLSHTDIPLKDDTYRPRLESTLEHWFEARDAARKHAFPLGVAAFVLGAAILSLAARGLAGKPGGRSALVQVIGVQAVLAIVTFSATKEIRWAEREVDIVRAMGNPPRPFQSHDEQEQQERLMRAALALMGPTALGARTLMALFVVFALTRPRAREFLEPASAEE